MAKSVPACSATSKVSPGSLQFASPSRVTSQGMSARCAVLETGRNSVSPCTMPRTIASRIGKLFHRVPKCGHVVLNHIYQTLGAAGPIRIGGVLRDQFLANREDPAGRVVGFLL